MKTLVCIAFAALLLCIPVCVKAQSVSGTWLVSYKFSEEAKGKVQWRIKQSGQKLSVSSRQSFEDNLWGDWKKQPAGKIVGKSITVHIIELHQGVQKADYVGTVKGAKMSGTIKGGGTWTASRLH